MKECDILRGGVKTYFDPSYIFLGGQNLPTPRIYAPRATRAVDDQLWEGQHMNHDLWGLLAMGHLHPRFGV